MTKLVLTIIDKSGGEGYKQDDALARFQGKASALSKCVEEGN